MTVRVARLTFRRRTEYGGHVVVAFDVSLTCKVQIAAIGLRLAREGVFQVLFRLAALELHGSSKNTVLTFANQRRQAI
jgi:hypothetical protein